jgi:hypothetical protein
MNTETELPRDLAEFQSRLAALAPGTTVSVDAPRRPDGEWWLDADVRGRTETLSWRLGIGFGLFVRGDHGYGERPDEVVADPAAAARRVVAIGADGEGNS